MTIGSRVENLFGTGTPPTPVSGGPYIDLVDEGVPDGDSDAGPAIQALLDATVTTGCVLYFDPGRRWAIGTKVVARSTYPVQLLSDMHGSRLDGTSGHTYADYGVVRPLNDLDYMFEWDVPSGGSFVDTGGGSVEGMNFADWIMPATAGSKVISGAVNIKSARRFLLSDCNFQWLRGRAFRVGTSIFCTARNVEVYSCGAATKPAVDIDGGGSNGFLWWDRGFIENNQYGNSNVVRVNNACRLSAQGLYFENSVPSGYCPFIDATDGGNLYLWDSFFQNNQHSSIIVNAKAFLGNIWINNFPTGGNHAIWLKNAAHRSQLNNIHFECAAHASAIRCDASWCKINDVYFEGTCFEYPVLKFTGSQCALSDAYLYLNTGTADEFLVDLGDTVFDNGRIIGFSLCPNWGVQTTVNRVANVEVQGLQNGKAFKTNGSAAQLLNCRAFSNGTGDNYDVYPGTDVRNCLGSNVIATSVADNANQSTVTANGAEGIITTPSLTLAAGDEYRLILNNNFIITGSKVNVTLTRASDTASKRYHLLEAYSYTGVCEILFRNAHASAAMNGTMQVKFSVENLS